MQILSTNYLYKNLILFKSLIEIFILGIIFIENIFLSASIANTSFLIFQLLILYFLILFFSIWKNGIFNLYTLLLLTLLLFNYGYIFLCEIEGSSDYKIVYSFITFYHSDIILKNTIFLHTVFLLCLDISYSLINANSKLVKGHNKLSFNINLFPIGVIIFKFFLLFALIRALLEVKILYNNRLLLFQTGSYDELGIPFWLRIASMCFKIGYFIILMSIPTKKDFIKFSIIYFLILIPGLIIGNRAEFSATFLFIFWYLYKFYNYQPKFKSIIIGLFIIVILLQLIALNRSNSELNVNILELFRMFISNQCMSFNVLPLYLEHSNITLPYPAVLDSVVSGVVGGVGQTLDTLKVRSSLGHQLMYAMSPEAYLAGVSLGTSYIAELSQFGLSGIVLGSSFLGFFTNWFDKNITKNRILIFLSLMFFSAIIMSPRASLLPSLYAIIRNLIFYIILYFLTNKLIYISNYKNV